MPIFGGLQTDMPSATKDSQTEPSAEETQKEHEKLSHKKRHSCKSPAQLHDALDAPSELQQKVHDLIHHDEQTQQQKVEQDQHISDKVKEILHRAPEEPKKHHALWAGQNQGEKQQQKEGWGDKLHMLSKKEEPPQESWLQGTARVTMIADSFSLIHYRQIHGITGNDQKKKKEGEWNENALINVSAAIDFVQEHVLHQDD
ncbi:hypothetical protein EIP86_006885 [Pleurotus ostreatoroseus]|nr:hypothetical protein EIP86_006885 [Pleurotus ostreatoroseus]